jgi:hypothetical protein
MRIDRLVIAVTALAASAVMVGCGSDNNSNSPGNSTNVTTPSLGSTSLSSTPLSTTPLNTTGSSTMDTSSGATTVP